MIGRARDERFIEMLEAGASEAELEAFLTVFNEEAEKQGSALRQRAAAVLRAAPDASVEWCGKTLLGE